jgi:hypothetical protein
MPSDAVVPARTREVLEGSQQLMLYSLEPRPGVEYGGPEFHGFPVLGESAVIGFQQRSALTRHLPSCRADTRSPATYPRPLRYFPAQSATTSRFHRALRPTLVSPHPLCHAASRSASPTPYASWLWTRAA